MSIYLPAAPCPRSSPFGAYLESFPRFNPFGPHRLVNGKISASHGRLSREGRVYVVYNVESVAFGVFRTADFYTRSFSRVWCAFADPPSVETVPASGELEVNLGEDVDMQCVAKGVPAPIIGWRMKVIDIHGTVYANDIRRFARGSATGMLDREKERTRKRVSEKERDEGESATRIFRLRNSSGAEAFD